MVLNRCGAEGTKEREKELIMQVHRSSLSESFLRSPAVHAEKKERKKKDRLTSQSRRG